MDRSAANFLRNLHPPTYFMPHAVERDFTYDPGRDRPYDLVLLGTCIDFEAIAESWNIRYPKPLADAIFDAAEITLSDKETSFSQAFIQTIDGVLKAGNVPNIRSFDMIAILNELEYYVRGYDRARFIRSIKDARIDIFGNTKNEWQRCLKNQANCVFHGQISFLDALEIMKQAKIVLNSCIAIKAGGHERIFTGMAAGALVIAHENNYMRETFNHDDNIVFYDTDKLDRLNDTINELLNDEEKRATIAKKGYDTVMKYHTWDNRVAELSKLLDPGSANPSSPSK